MIIAYVGTPGSGKSYEAVSKILDNLKSGRIVVTNIDGIETAESRQYIKVYTGLDDLQLFNQLHFLDNEQMLNFPDYLEGKEGALIVIDEVHKLFSNRNWQKKENIKFTEWSSTHRHAGFDLLLITQDLAKIDAHERTLIEWTYFYRKINHFGKMVKNKYRRHIYDSDDHKGKALSSQTLTYKKSIFPCYKSYDSTEVKELGIQKTVNMFKHPVFFAIPVLLIFFVYNLTQSSWIHGDVFGTSNIEKRYKEQHEKKTDNKLAQVTEGKDKSSGDSLPTLPRNVVILYKLSDGSTHVTNNINTLPVGPTIVKQVVMSVKPRAQEG